MKVEKNLITLSEDEASIICQAEDILNRVLDEYDEGCMYGVGTVQSSDGLPYCIQNIDDAWQALYKLNIETEKEDGTTDY